jgi:glycosyltransferase involved in cell wall biosynthesis
MQPLVSVIVATFRRPQRLWKALESVGNQTYSDVELIVVNDGGVPVGEMIDRYIASFRRPVKYIPLPQNRGLAAARNIGIMAAAGDILALLDDDDRFFPTHLERLVPALGEDPRRVLTYDDVLILIENGTEEDAEPHIIATCRFGRPYEQVVFDQNDYIVPSSMVLSRKAFEAAGRFDETIPICEDWEFLLRLRKLGNFHYVAGDIGIEYSFRARTLDNLSAQFDETRRKILDMLSATYGLPHLGPKTFLDVARDLGFAIVPTDRSLTTEQAMGVKQTRGGKRHT